jgi:hypothetical protein
MYLKSKNQRRSDGQKDLHGFRDQSTNPKQER